MSARRLVAVLSAAAALTAIPATVAHADVIGRGGGSGQCGGGSALYYEGWFLISAPTIEETEGPDAKLVGLEATNPCNDVVSLSFSVRKRNGQPLTLVYTVPAHTDAAVSRSQLRRYGVGTKYVFTNSYGANSGAYPSGPGVIFLN